MDQRLDGMRIAIIVSNDFEQVEMTEPRKALDQAGAKTTLISPKPGQFQGISHDEKGDKFAVELTLDQADAGEFDALLLPGDAMNADALRVEAKAQQFARAMDDAGKPLAVICHAPWLLASAKLLSGCTLTSYHTIQDDIRNAGGPWVDQEAVRDRNWEPAGSRRIPPHSTARCSPCSRKRKPDSFKAPLGGQTALRAAKGDWASVRRNEGHTERPCYDAGMPAARENRQWWRADPLFAGGAWLPYLPM